MERMDKEKAAVIIPNNSDILPEPHEVTVAWILARHYNCLVEFLKPINSYKIKTPDFVMNGVLWEIKSPKGNSKKHTIKDQFKNAKGKMHHLVMDGHRTALDDSFIENKIRFELQTHRSVKKLIFIKKNDEVIEIK
jgi:hypothetical protein